MIRFFSLLLGGTVGIYLLEVSWQYNMSVSTNKLLRYFLDVFSIFEGLFIQDDPDKVNGEILWNTDFSSICSKLKMRCCLLNLSKTKYLSKYMKFYDFPFIAYEYTEFIIVIN